MSKCNSCKLQISKSKTNCTVCKKMFHIKCVQRRTCGSCLQRCIYCEKKRELVCCFKCGKWFHFDCLLCAASGAASKCEEEENKNGLMRDDIIENLEQTFNVKDYLKLAAESEMCFSCIQKAVQSLDIKDILRINGFTFVEMNRKPMIVKGKVDESEFKKIFVGRRTMAVKHCSPFPMLAETIYICELCLSPFNEMLVYKRHQFKCLAGIPGVTIYSEMIGGDKKFSTEIAVDLGSKDLKNNLGDLDSKYLKNNPEDLGSIENTDDFQTTSLRNVLQSESKKIGPDKNKKRNYPKNRKSSSGYKSIIKNPAKQKRNEAEGSHNHESDGELIVRQVDGAIDTQFCRNLCLIAKCFLEHKTLYYDVELFLFYVLYIGSRLVGYFSKEKYCHKYNLSCIVVLPIYRGMGYGHFLVDLSYKISKFAGRVGTPEKPLSNSGLVLYKKYWMYRVYNAIKNETKIKIQSISNLTGMTINDVVYALELLGFLSNKEPLCINFEKREFKVLRTANENFVKYKMLYKE